MPCVKVRRKHCSFHVAFSIGKGKVVMEILEDGIGGGVPRLLAGLGVMVAAPVVLPAVAAGVRPLARSLIKGYLVVAGGMREVVAETREQLSDLVAEARSEAPEVVGEAAGAGGKVESEKAQHSIAPRQDLSEAEAWRPLAPGSSTPYRAGYASSSPS